MIYDLTLLFNHVMDQTKNHNFKKMKFHKIIIFHDDGRNLNIVLYLDNQMKNTY
jgi:hypothetical protein